MTEPRSLIRRSLALTLCVASAGALAASAPYALAQTGPDLGEEPPSLSPSGGFGPGADNGTVSLLSGSHALIGRRVALTGTVRRSDHRRWLVVIERLDPRDGRWERVARVTPGRRGDFAGRWRADRLGDVHLRAALVPRAQSASAPRVRLGGGETSVLVMRAAKATMYGPGMFGAQTACGVTLTKDTLGVAHRTLPCGTKVHIYYRGRAIVVPVIDRGPFREDVDWDLTAAAARVLSFGGLDTIGVSSVPSTATRSRR
jgi:hypothetical protein